MSAKDRDQLYHYAKGVGDQLDQIQREQLPSTVTVTCNRNGYTNGMHQSVFKITFSKLSDLSWGPFAMGETIRELTICALLSPLDARSLVFDAATNGEATTETG